MRKLLEGMIDQWRDEGKYQEVTVETYSGASVGDTQCRMLEVIHPKAREHFKYHKSRLYLDAKSKFPIRLEQYVWPQKEGDEPVLVEEYIYTDIKINSGFTDADFDKNNKAYAY